MPCLSHAVYVSSLKCLVYCGKRLGVFSQGGEPDRGLLKLKTYSASGVFGTPGPADVGEGSARYQTLYISTSALRGSTMMGKDA